VVSVLKQLKPLHTTEESYVFLNVEGQPLDFHTWCGERRGKSDDKEKASRGVWYRMSRAAGVRERKPYTMRHTFISAGLTNGVNPKWLAEYCGTSLQMIEKHYGKYMRNDAAEQLAKLAGTMTQTETLPKRKRAIVGKVGENPSERSWWAHLDSNYS
jgi:integrase